MKTFFESVNIYSTKKLKCCFYSEYINLLPSSPNKNQKPYPIILQFKIDSEEPYFRFSNGNQDPLSKKIIEIEQLLSLFTQYYFFGYKKRKNPIKRMSTSKNEITKYGTKRWYQDLSIDDLNVDEVVLPENLQLLFEAYENLDSKKKEFFKKALLLNYRAIEIKHLYPSFSFISFISAIETLCQIEFKEQDKKITEHGCCHTIMNSPWKCEKCGSPIWGISKKYKLFVTKYCFGDKATELDAQFLSRVYGIRSKIVHTGKMLLADDFWSEEGIDWSQSFLHKDLLAFTRVSMINWLLINGLNLTTASTGQS